MSDDILIEIYLEGQVKAQAKLRVQYSATLRDMHNAFIGAKPVFQAKEFVYMYGDKPVFREFWDVFEAQHMENKRLVMRYGTYNVKLTAFEDEEIIPVVAKKSIIKSPGSPTPASTNSHRDSVNFVEKPVIKENPANFTFAGARKSQMLNENSNVEVGKKVPGKLNIAGIDVNAMVGGLKQMAGNAPTPTVQDAAPKKIFKQVSEPMIVQSPVSKEENVYVAPLVNKHVQNVINRPESPVSETLQGMVRKEYQVNSPTSDEQNDSEQEAGAAEVISPKSNEKPIDLTGGKSGLSKQVKRVEAVFSYKARSVDQLSFQKGDIMEILIFRPKGKWWFARLEDKKGWIPHNFVKIFDDEAGPPEPSEDPIETPKDSLFSPVSKGKQQASPLSRK